MSVAGESSPSVRQFWLRPLSAAHLPAITAWHEQIEDLSLFDRRTPVPPSAEAMEAAWRESIEGSYPRTSEWFAAEDGAGACLALVGLQDINYVHGDGVVALIVAEQARNRGIAVRAGALLLDMAFHQLRLTRVTSYHRADNEPSRRMMRAWGFREEGLVRGGWFAGGVHHDVVAIGLLAAEWHEQRAVLDQQLDAGVVVTLGSRRGRTWSWPPRHRRANPE